MGSIHLLGKEPGDPERSDLCYRQDGLQNRAWHVFSTDWAAGPKEPAKSRVAVGIGCWGYQKPAQVDQTEYAERATRAIPARGICEARNFGAHQRGRLGTNG